MGEGGDDRQGDQGDEGSNDKEAEMVNRDWHRVFDEARKAYEEEFRRTVREEYERIGRAQQEIDRAEEERATVSLDALKITKEGYGTGRRKTSVARIWVRPGTGKLSINRRDVWTLFPSSTTREHMLEPLLITNTHKKVDVVGHVEGGGVSGQAGAIRLGIARALYQIEPGLKPVLRHINALTRDSRMVERKKPGQKKARKKFQWVKR